MSAALCYLHVPGFEGIPVVASRQVLLKGDAHQSCLLHSHAVDALGTTTDDQFRLVLVQHPDDELSGIAGSDLVFTEQSATYDCEPHQQSPRYPFLHISLTASSSSVQQSSQRVRSA